MQVANNIRDARNIFKSLSNYLISLVILILLVSGVLYYWNLRVTSDKQKIVDSFKEQSVTVQFFLNEEVTEISEVAGSLAIVLSETENPLEIDSQSLELVHKEFTAIKSIHVSESALPENLTGSVYEIIKPLRGKWAGKLYLHAVVDSSVVMVSVLSHLPISTGLGIELLQNGRSLYSSVPKSTSKHYDLFDVSSFTVNDLIFESRLFGSTSDLGVMVLNQSNDYIIVILGVGFALMLFSVLYFFASSRATAYKMAFGMNEELRNYQARVSGLLKNLPVGVFYADGTTGEGIIMNPAAELFLGAGLSRFLHKDNYTNYFRLLQEDKTEFPNEEFPVNVTLQTKKTVERDDIVRLMPDGTLLNLRIKSTPVIDPDGSMKYVVAIIEDITKELKIDRMKTEFISLASHQLRTPLSAIKWFSEILLDGDAGELKTEQKYYLKNIDTSNQRMIDLVNSLLNISRIESGRIIIDPQPTNITEMLNECVKEVENKFKSKQQSLTVNVASDVPEVKIDAKLVRQAVLNLLTNSIKYTKLKGTISVRVSKGDDVILFEVNDNGMGIPKSAFDRVFSRFYRAPNVVKVETDGTGLGLYLVKSIVESSGGKIWFMSEENKGTSFYFTLPLAGSKPHKGEVSLS